MTIRRRLIGRLKSPDRWLLTTCLALAWLTLSMGLVGCNTFTGNKAGQVQLHSILDDDQRIDTRFTHGVYQQDDEASATMVLFAGPPEQPSRAMTVRLFWVPRAGATPLHADSTNATMHYVVFEADDEQPTAAIYSGAGFVFPRDRLGQSTLRLRMLDISIHLADAVDDFEDPIGRGRLTGDIVLTHDREATQEALARIHEFIQERLGRSRLVHRE